MIKLDKLRPAIKSQEIN